MIKTLPTSQQRLIYLIGGFTMLSAAFLILNEMNYWIFLFLFMVGMASIGQLNWAVYDNNHSPSKWGLNLLRMSKQLTPEAYTTIEITPCGYEFKAQIQELLENIIKQAVWRIAKHMRAEKTEIKIDVLEETSLLFIQVKGAANSELEALELIQATDQQISAYVQTLNGSTIIESDKNETAILIEFPNEQS